MKTITELIQEYHTGSSYACSEILKRMAPLAKKYAGKIHCMEYEDALQELYLALLESLNYLNASYPEGKCIKYMETAVINRYYALCKRYLSCPDTEDLEDHVSDIPTASPYDDSLLDVEAYIASLPSTGYKRQILSLFFYNDLSDKEIAEKLDISRQYVNRIKKALIKKYLLQHLQ